MQHGLGRGAPRELDRNESLRRIQSVWPRPPLRIDGRAKSGREARGSGRAQAGAALACYRGTAEP